MKHFRTFKKAADQIAEMCSGDEQLEDMTFYFWNLSHSERAVGECHKEALEYLRTSGGSGNSGPSVQKLACHSEVF